MDITSLATLLKQTKVVFKENGMEIYVPQSWIVEGEKRLSYTTLIRLTECCREYHWEKDILPLNRCTDSICGHINANFSKPVNSEQVILITYKVRCVFEKKYILDLYIYDETRNLCGCVDMILYFYDSQKQISVCAPCELYEVKG